MCDRFVEAVINEPGVIRMSEVLEEFLEPYLEMIHTHRERDTLFSLGVFAWNAALLPQSESNDSIKHLLNLATKNDLVASEIQEILDGMIERKLEYFADIRRVIINIELTGQEDDFHLSVASTECTSPRSS